MKKEWKEFVQKTRPLAAKDAVIRGDTYRFTVLTDRLIRMEYKEDGTFTDEPTQTIVCREFPVPEYRVMEKENRLEIVTEELHLYYDKQPFSGEGLTIQLRNGYAVYGSVWNYGDELHDLLGTARTLDNADGAVELEHGLMSRDGFSVLDDSKSAVLTFDGWIAPREGGGQDLYFFGYGHDYLGCLKDFYHLCGETPMLPRYALGNWWSRFYPYTEKSYLELMDQFREHQIPFSTAVIDMDWHLTQIPEKYGSGWTGYTWNREYFPDPERFLKSLHKRGMHVTLNVHPADGVRAHEEAYPEMAKELGIQYEKEDKIPFDATDRKFMEAYFTYLHHPKEEEGVDFWWIDWQQGKKSKIPGIDTLWMLNHLHFLDNGRKDKLPLTFSRYAGIGSHRYPIGFSGDSVSSWKSLDFQPYFTANASNAGYTWWSHDIGGHQKGARDDEMAVRWVQLGVFSPIMRLHSTSNAFYGKEPWNYNMLAEKVMTDFLQLRHRLIPYLHTMNYRTHTEGIPLVMPMYYINDIPEAYEVPNEYYFGTSMIVCPMTKPVDKETLQAEFDAWIPEGIYYDFFNGRVYRGGKKLILYRNMETIPVLIPAGSILPLAGDFMEAHHRNPKILDVMVYHGADGRFDLYEDDCSERKSMDSAITHFSYQSGKDAEFSIEICGDERGMILTEREYRIHFCGVEEPEEIMLLERMHTDYGEKDEVQRQESGNSEIENGMVIPYERHYDAKNKVVTISFHGRSLNEYTVRLRYGQEGIVSPDKKQAIYKLLHFAQMEYDLKEKIYQKVLSEESAPRILAELHELKLKPQLYGAILECLVSDC